MSDKKPDENTLWTESIYGAKTREALVKLTINGGEAYCTVKQARSFANDIFDCANAAEADAFLVDFIADKVGQGLPGAVMILGDFREWRAEKAAKEINGG